MKKILMLVVLTIAIGAFPIVASAKESPANEPYPTYLNDVDEDGAITYRDVLDYVVLTTIPKYDEQSVQARELWSIHEEVKKLSEEEAKEFLDTVILNY